MDVQLQDRIGLMVQLGKYLSGGSEELKSVKEKAFHHNSWFIPEFIDLSLRSIAEQYLQPRLLRDWVHLYPAFSERRVKKDVGIVMAGNIPAVGFHDFLCAFISGHDISLRLSSKDDVLLRHFIEKLKSWEPSLEKHISIKEMLKGCDAYITTGSNNSARYFEFYFRKYPHIIRRNRTSVAVLTGEENTEDLDGLADDVFTYFGLGCRNVTKLLIPQDYDFDPLMKAFKRYAFLKDFHHYSNNYDYHLSIALLNKINYFTNDMVLFFEERSPFSPVSVIHFEKYDDISEVQDSLSENEDIQAIVGGLGIPFGSAQHPKLDDYADGTDTMRFLSEL